MNELSRTVPHVLLIGDSCIDEYIYGTVDRISPEAPVPVLKFSSKSTKHGMASNVLANLQSFNILTTFKTNTEKSIKTRYVDERSEQQIVRVDDDVLTAECDTSSLCFDGIDCVVISDYDKGFVTDLTIQYVIDNFSGPIFIDTKKKNMGQFSKENVYFKINEKEWAECESSASNTIVTLGKAGALFKDRLYKAPTVDTFDVTGAGDTFLSALTWAYLTYATIDKAIAMANRAAAISVQHRGVYTLKDEDINEIKEWSY